MVEPLNPIKGGKFSIGLGILSLLGIVAIALLVRWISNQFFRNEVATYDADGNYLGKSETKEFLTNPFKDGAKAETTAATASPTTKKV